MNQTKRAFLGILILTLTSILMAGCNAPQRRGDISDFGPVTDAKMRIGSYFGQPFGMDYTDPENLGQHHSRGGKEINGLVYTCKGGFIDVGHVREAADRTAYAKGIVCKNLLDHNKIFSLNIIEPSTYYLTISYPPDWDKFSEKEKKKIANEVSIDIGQYVAQMSMIWHEIITWYGFSTTGVFSEKISSFSWEDPYSDLMGTYLGAWAMRDDKTDYDEAVAKLLDKELKELDAQRPEMCRDAVKQIKGQWYSGGSYFSVHMYKRSFDVGYNNGYITPVRVPGICNECKPKLYPKPSLGSLDIYGFGLMVEMEPKIGEKAKIYSEINLDGSERIRPPLHFSMIIEQISKEHKAIVEGSKMKGKEETITNAQQY